MGLFGADSECGFGVYGPFGIPIFEGPKARACRKELRNENAADKRDTKVEKKEIEEESDVLKAVARSEEDILQTYFRNIDGVTAGEAIGVAGMAALPGVAGAVTTGVVTAATGGVGGIGAVLDGVAGAMGGGAAPSPPVSSSMFSLEGSGGMLALGGILLVTLAFAASNKGK